MSTERTGLHALVTVVVLLATLAPALARADERELARLHFGRGASHFAAGRFSEARTEFALAYRAMPDARVLANTAACYAAERRPVDAVRTYRRFLAIGGRQLPDDVRRRTEGEIRRLQRAVGDVALEVEPSGAEVRVDGTFVGTAPFSAPVAVEPGARRIEVRLPGQGALSRTVRVAPGQEVAVTIVLAGSGGGSGSIFRVEGERSNVRRTLLWAGAGTTAALALGAGITGALTLRNENEYENSGTSLRRRETLYDRTRTLSVVTDVLIDAAALAGLATLGYALLGSEPDAPTERPVAGDLHIRPRFAAGGAQCELSWVF